MDRYDNFMTRSQINSLITLVNNFMPSEDISLQKDDIIRTEMFIHDAALLKDLIKKGKFKRKGSLLDYPEFFPRTVDDSEDIGVLKEKKYYKKIYVSNKYNSVIVINKTYSFKVYFILDKKHSDKIGKIVKKVIKYGNMSDTTFSDVKFTTKPGKYVEIVNEYDSSTGRDFSVNIKKIDDELLVFSDDTNLLDVFKDISNFFKDKTQKLYKKAQISYKRGIIIYGEPGNGKSAIIREIIRTTPDVIKILINPQIYNVTRVLTALISKLKGQKVMIIIEDVDSLITSENRSAFLNILDGIESVSGLFFVGTTNYPERIDSAFMNRGGRFDKSYKIDNPSEGMRRAYFKSRGVSELLGEFKNKGKKSIVELFVKHSEDFSMANLKELILMTQYKLTEYGSPDIADCIKDAADAIKDNKNSHDEEYDEYSSRRPIPYRRAGRRGQRHYDEF